MHAATSKVPVSGFVLLEVVLALALFASVATAMTVAMNQLAVSTTSARRESILLRRLQSEIAETAHQPQLELGRSSEPEDATGIFVEREVSRLKVTNREGAPLDGLYRIRITGTMAHSQTGRTAPRAPPARTARTRFLGSSRSRSPGGR